MLCHLLVGRHLDRSLKAALSPSIAAARCAKCAGPTDARCRRRPGPPNQSGTSCGFLDAGRAVMLAVAFCFMLKSKMGGSSSTCRHSVALLSKWLQGPSEPTLLRCHPSLACQHDVAAGHSNEACNIQVYCNIQHILNAHARDMSYERNGSP